MTANPDSVAPDVDATDAFASLSEHGYRHIPVVDDDEVVGIVSMRDLMRIAQIQPAENLAHEIPRGLEGVVVADTDDRRRAWPRRLLPLPPVQRGRARREALARGRLVPAVRGRAAHDGTSARRSTREVAPLREIPRGGEGRAPRRSRALGRDAPPLDMLRTTVSLIGAALGFRPSLDIDDAELRTQALQVCAVVPTLSHVDLPAAARPRADRPGPDARRTPPTTSTCCSGEVPPAEHARAVEQYLISTIDHGFNASTFTARVITSTGADLAAAVIGAIGALSGPLHGGAPSRALDMLDAIGTIDNAEPWLRDAVERGDRLMGFGHRVYKTDDPRSRHAARRRRAARRRQVELAKQIEAKAIEVLAELKPGRKLYTNVEFYAGIVMDSCGAAPRRCSRRRSRRAG